MQSGLCLIAYMSDAETDVDGTLAVISVRASDLELRQICLRHFTFPSLTQNGGTNIITIR
jgi:hypothetical protein